MLKTVAQSGVTGALVYQGTWNASTNNPTLTSSVGTKGYYYVVSTAGSTNLDGTTLWGVGDWAVFNGSIWQKVDGGDTGNFVNISVSALTGYMYANGTSNVTASTTIPSGNVSGLGTMATQNANAVVITGGTINSTTETNGKYTNANVTSVAVTFPNSFLANSTTTLGNTALTLGGTTSSVGNVTLTNVTIGSGNVNVTSTTVAATTNANATFSTSSLLLVPQGFINVNLNGTVVRVPYYAT
jgi:fructose-specific component phosphotransferase system IIB-like protein